MCINWSVRYPNFRPVPFVDFKEWLTKFSPDFFRDAIGDGIRYKFRYNQEVFAYDLEKGTVWVDPKLLEPCFS